MSFNAVDEASRALNEIPFEDFTTSLLQGVFNTLIDTNIQQIETYMELVNGVQKGLESYINNTADDIDDEEILNYLHALPELLVEDSSDTTNTYDNLIDAASTSSGMVAIADTALNALSQNLTIPGVYEPSFANNSEATTEPTTVSSQEIFDAVAKKIAAGRFESLETMVKMGLLRTVVDHGEIESRLTFQIRTRHVEDVRLKDKTKIKDKHIEKFKTKNKVKTGLLFNLFGKAKHKKTSQSMDKNTTVNIKTLSEHDRDVSGSSVKFYSRVKLTFKTDYFPLAEMK